LECDLPIIGALWSFVRPNVDVVAGQLSVTLPCKAGCEAAKSHTEHINQTSCMRQILIMAKKQTRESSTSTLGCLVFATKKSKDEHMSSPQ
jgi:hypothetical protein